MHLDTILIAISALAASVSQTQIVIDRQINPLPAGAVARFEMLGIPTAAKQAPRAVNSLAFSPAGKVLAAGSSQASVVMMWDVHTGLPVQPPLLHHGPLGLRFSPDATQLCFYSNSRPVVLDLGSQRVDSRADPALPRDAAMIHWLPKSKTWIRHAGKPPGIFRSRGDVARHVKIQLVEAGSKKVMREFDIEGHFVQASPDGRFLLSAHAGDNLLLIMNSETPLQAVGPWMVWDAETGQKRCELSDRSQPIQPYKHTGGAGYAYLHLLAWGGPMAYSPDGRLVAWRSPSGAINVTDLDAGRLHATIPATTGLIAFSADGKTIACGDDKTVQLYETATGKMRSRLDGHRATLTSLEFSKNGVLLASGSQDGAIYVWDAVKRATRQGRTDLAAAWDDLAQADAAKAHDAAGALADQKDQAVKLLRARIADYADTFERETRPLIKALDSDVYKVRQQAQLKLRQHGAFALPALRSALAQPVTPELRRRLETLQNEAGTSPSGAWLQAYRGLELLERLGAADALESLSKRSADSPVAQEARRCLERVHDQEPRTQSGLAHNPKSQRNEE